MAIARAVDEPRTAVAALDGALVLWRGQALAEFASEDWARPTAVRLEEIRAGAFEDRAEVLLRLGEHVRATAGLTAHIDAFPFRDRARGLLMRSRLRDAIPRPYVVYQTYRRYLADEVGVEPSDTLRGSTGASRQGGETTFLPHRWWWLLHQAGRRQTCLRRRRRSSVARASSKSSAH